MPTDPGLRAPRGDEVAALGALLHAAYQGTVDDEGESPEQAQAVVAATLAGEYGPFLPEASTVLERGGQLLSASMVTLWQGRPLLAFAMTSPDHKRRGLSAACTARAMQVLARQGHTELRLFVTASNAPAIALYRRLGFSESATGAG